MRNHINVLRNLSLTSRTDFKAEDCNADIAAANISKSISPLVVTKTCPPPFPLFPLFPFPFALERGPVEPLFPPLPDVLVTSRVLAKDWISLLQFCIVDSTSFVSFSFSATAVRFALAESLCRTTGMVLQWQHAKSSTFHPHSVILHALGTPLQSFVALTDALVQRFGQLTACRKTGRSLEKTAARKDCH